MATEKILIPDIGDFDSVDVIEILINIGDSINPDDPMLTVESDKASMDIPAPHSGVIKEIKVKVGDKVKQGSLVAVFEKTQISDENSTKESSTKKNLMILKVKLLLNQQVQFLSRLQQSSRLKNRYLFLKARLLRKIILAMHLHL